MRVCRTAVVKCPSVIKFPPLWVEVIPKTKIGECEVSFASPSPCVITPATEIKISEPVKIEVTELEEDVEITVSTERDVSYYVYPKSVWERVNEYLDGFMTKGYPEEPAMILIGPPGTGKSSMMKIIADYLGLYTVEVAPETTLSMWLGQSEKKLRRAFDEAENNSPSLILFDEAEWIISKSASLRRASSDFTFINMRTILKRKIDEHGKTKAPILTIFASNIAEEDIEETLIRSGRAYRPIFIPLPDWHAIKRVIERYFPEKASEAEKLATILLNMGQSMADVMKVMRDYIRTGKLKIEEMKSRGYSRLYLSPEIAGDENVKSYLREIADRYDLQRIVRHPSPKIFIECPYHLCAPILAASIVTITKRPVMTISDARYIDEAADMARSINAILLIPSDFLPRDIVQNMLAQKIPTVFIGKERVEGAYHMKITVVPKDKRLRPTVMKILAEMLRIEIEKKDEEKIREEIDRMTDADYERFLEAFTETGSITLSTKKL
jgi:SpoVK/Ycf46/Vps4 family AAA+-type ATPase